MRGMLIVKVERHALAFLGYPPADGGLASGARTSSPVPGDLDFAIHQDFSLHSFRPPMSNREIVLHGLTPNR